MSEVRVQRTDDGRRKQKEIENRKEKRRKGKRSDIRC